MKQSNADIGRVSVSFKEYGDFMDELMSKLPPFKMDYDLAYENGRYAINAFNDEQSLLWLMIRHPECRDAVIDNEITIEDFAFSCTRFVFSWLVAARARGLLVNQEAIADALSKEYPGTDRSYWQFALDFFRGDYPYENVIDNMRYRVGFLIEGVEARKSGRQKWGK